MGKNTNANNTSPEWIATFRTQPKKFFGIMIKALKAQEKNINNHLMKNHSCADNAGYRDTLDAAIRDMEHALKLIENAEEEQDILPVFSQVISNEFIPLKAKIKGKKWGGALVELSNYSLDIGIESIPSNSTQEHELYQNENIQTTLKNSIAAGLIYCYQQVDLRGGLDLTTRENTSSSIEWESLEEARNITQSFIESQLLFLHSLKETPEYTTLPKATAQRIDNATTELQGALDSIDQDESSNDLLASTTNLLDNQSCFFQLSQRTSFTDAASSSNDFLQDITDSLQSSMETLNAMQCGLETLIRKENNSHTRYHSR
jgi:hypothetical protein